MVASRIFAILSALPLSSGQADGNPHQWDRVRRCDHTDYDPPCGPCEGVGGYVNSDKADDYSAVSCQLEQVHDASSRKRPVWGADFTEKASHEILIGKKQDPACFQAFPSNDSTAENCYKPQEVQIFSEMNQYRALIMTANQAGNAWGLAGNVSSVIYHQGPNMWIVNVLGLGLVNQCVCTSPREGGDPTKPEVGPVQYNWVDNLFYVATETLGVEYGVGDMTLDHWAFGPHHAWTDPETGIIVRMWQPFNGLQIFTPGAWSEGHAVDDAVHKGWFKTEKLFEQIATDGSKAPDWCTKDNAPLNTFRIKCQDDGFPQKKDDASDILSHLDMAKDPVGNNQAHRSDLQRARSKVPRDEFKGEDFESMSSTLNEFLLRHAPNSKECDQWTVEELQELQLSLLMLRDPQLNDVYEGMNDRRQIKGIESIVAEWEELNQKASTDPELAKAHRDGHCHEAVMWYVHHLPQSMKDLISSKISLPLLSAMQHEQKTALHSEAVHKAYQEKVSCASCHSFTYPGAVTV